MHNQLVVRDIETFADLALFEVVEVNGCRFLCVFSGDRPVGALRCARAFAIDDECKQTPCSGGGVLRVPYGLASLSIPCEGLSDDVLMRIDVGFSGGSLELGPVGYGNLSRIY
ncbi:hypothetical protein [Vulcanisaeta distributa]|uniref:hypothetical protein n=1 Tax=Vulcanisaeta distributa TaxID=164451 RepID=UPI0006D11339|nr:hypothetical protein [Vulcanisaeta distributa]